MNILVDTREQLPLWLGTPKTLNVGDYTTEILLNQFHIERKSPGDLYGTLLKGHNRFRKEIQRARDKGITLTVFVECGEKKFYAKNWPGGKFCKFPGDTIKKCIATMRVKYGLEFNFYNSRNLCRKAVYKRLLYEESVRLYNMLLLSPRLRKKTPII